MHYPGRGLVYQLKQGRCSTYLPVFDCGDSCLCPTRMRWAPAGLSLIALLTNHRGVAGVGVLAEAARDRMGYGPGIVEFEVGADVDAVLELDNPRPVSHTIPSSFSKHTDPSHTAMVG